MSTSSGRILQCFINADLRLGHPGLSALARKYKINVDQMGAGEFIVFINPRRTKMKIYAANQVLAYIRPKSGHVDLNTVRYFPAVFNAKGKIDYDEALKVSITEALKHDGNVKEMKVFTSAKAVN